LRKNHGISHYWYRSSCYNLAREWRKLNPEKALVIISRDDGRNYSKPMLSTGYTKGKTADQLAMQSAAQMSEQLKAEIC